MAERNLNTALKKRLINNEPFVYAHLIKYERPHGANKDGKHSTDAKRYAYLTDGAVNIDFNDGSFATDGTTANGTQTYVADKIAKIGSYSETIEAKATGMTLTISAESLNNSITASTITMTSSTITVPSSIDLVAEGFREGDKISITGGTNNGHEVRITGIKTNNTVLTVSNIDSTLATQNTGTSITIKIVSDELKGPLTEMNDSTLKSYHNRDVFIYKAFLDPDTYAIIGAPILVFKGIIASASLQDNPNKNLTVNWKLTSHWGDFAQVNGRPTSDSVHRAIDENGIGQPDVALKDVYASDLGFSHSDVTLSTMSTYKYMEKVPEMRTKRIGIFGLRRRYTQVWVDEEREAQVDLNWALSAKYLPVVYGVDLVEGIPIFVDTENDDPTAVYVAYAICEGEVGGIFDFYFDDHPRVCLNVEDFDARKSGGTEDADVVCIGRADLGTVLGGKALVDFNTETPDITEILNMLSQTGGEGTRGGKTTDIAYAKRMLHYYNMEAAYETQTGMDASADTGILHEQTHEVSTPNEMFLTFHAGLTHQRADDTLVSVANGSTKFKRQTDYYNGPDYWGPNHILSDTAYVVVKCTIGEDDESVPETKYVVRGKLIDCHNYDFSYRHDSLPTYSSESASHFKVGDTVDLKDGNTVINDDVIIIDKWDIATNQGTIETRFRFSDAPELTYSNGIPTITDFYMDNGSQQWHMVTSNHVANSGTVPSALTAVGTTSISSDKPIITFSSAPTWAWDSGAETFPKVNTIDDDLVPIAFIEGYDYDGNSYMAKQSSSGTILTILGTSKDNYVAASNVDVIRTDAIQLATSASTVDNQYNGMRIELTTIDSDGDYTIQKRKIVDYDGSLKVAQVNIPWDKNKFPKQDSTSTYTYKVLAPKDQRVSTNPAIQLLDYSTSETYGKRLDLDIDIELGSWLSAARTCDSRGTQKCYGSSLSATAGHRYVLTSDGNYDGDIIAMGKVKTTASSATNIEFEEVYGKFTKTFMADRHNYVIGDIIANHGGYYRVTSAGTQPAKTATVAATTSNSTTVTIETGGSISSSQVVFGLGIREHVTVSSVSGTTVTLSSAQSLVAGTKLYFCSNLTRLTSFNIHKLGASNNSTAIALTRTTDGTYDDTTEYSIYNSDFIKYWRQLGWESHHQRWVTRHQACTTLDTSNSVFNNINGMLQQFNGILSFEAGKYALRIEVESDDTEQTSDIATSSDTGYTIGTELNPRYITDDNIIGTIKVSDPGPKKSYNTVSSTISDPGNKFEGKQVSFYNSDFLRSDKNVVKSGNFAQPSIHNYYNARINVENYLKQSRYQTKVNFTLGPRGLLLVTGDVISLTHSKFGWNQKQFRIENLNFKTNCTVDISASEYDDSFYTITTPTLESNQIPSSRTPVPYSLSAPSSFTVAAGAAGQIDLIWKNAANLPSNSVTEIWYATGDTSDTSLRKYVASVTAAPKVVNQVNGAVSNSTTVTMDSVTDLVQGMLIRGTTALDAATITISSISGNNLTISSAQTIPDNTRLTFLSPGEYTHYIGLDGSDKTYWLRHSYTDIKSGKTYTSDFTSRVAITTVYPQTYRNVTLQSDKAIFTSEDGTLDALTIKITPTITNLDNNITWTTAGDGTGSGTDSIDLHTAASGGSTTTSGRVAVYLRHSSIANNTSVSVTATIVENSVTYAETVTFPLIDSTAAGAAKTVRIRSSGLVFLDDNTGTSTTPDSPDWIKLEAVKQNTSAAASWGTSPSVDLYAATSGGSATTSGNTVYMRKADYAANTNVLVTLTCDSITDTTSIIRLSRNSGIVQAVLTNPAHVLPADSDGAVSNTQAAGSGTDIRVYEGATALTFVPDGTGAGEWDVSVGNTADIVEGGDSDQGTYARIADHTSVTTGTDKYTITYTISGKKLDGTAFTNFTVDQNLTKAKAGIEGATAKIVSLTANDYSIVYDSAGNNPTPNTSTDITLTAATQGFTDPYFKFTGDGISDEGSYTDGSGSSDTFTFPVPAAIGSLTNPSAVKVSVQEGSSGGEVASDTISIYGVQPGATGGAGAENVELQIHYLGSAGSSSAPESGAAFTGGSYNFSNNTFTPPSGWTLAIPTFESYKPVWTSVATASAAAGGTDSSITWTAPALLSPGNEFLDIFYKRAATEPTPPTSNVNTTPSGWSTTIPSGSDTLWQVIATGVLTIGSHFRYYFGDVTRVSIPSYTVICTNESHTYPANNSGTVSSSAGSGTNFEVYRGGTQLTGVLTGTPTVDQFKVTASATNITASSTHGGSVASNAVVYANHTAGTIFSGASNLTAEISYSIAISTGVQAETVTKKQTFTKSLQGSVGDDGDDGDNTATVTMYQRTSSGSSAPAVINDTSTYTFATGVLSNSNGLDSWTQTVPSGAAQYLWTTTATAIGANGAATASVATGAWATPTVQSEATQPRSFSGVVFYDAWTSGTQAAPTASGFNWSTKQLSGLSSGWSNSNATIPFAFCQYTATEDTYEGTTTIAFKPVEYLNEISHGIPDRYSNASISISQGNSGVFTLTKYSGATDTTTITKSNLGLSYADGATVGATWGTNVGSRPTELTDGRISTALTSSGILDTTVPTAKGGTGETNTNKFLNSGISVAQSGSTFTLTRGDGGTNTTTISKSVLGLNYTDGATVGATWGTNIGSRPTELTDGRISTALTSSGILDTAVPQAKGGTGLTSNATLLNSAISLSAAGVLSGAGGGTVTTSGIGAETPAGSQSKVDSRLSSTEKTRLNAGNSPDNTKAFNNAAVDADHVGLGNVTNESKSTMFAGPTFTGTVAGVSKSHVGLSNVDNDSTSTIRAGTTKSDVGLSNVDNDSTSTIRAGTTAANVGLGSVENTALSSWAGTSNITTCGTIGTGSWQGTSISTSYTAATDNGTTINTSGNVTGTVDIASGGSITVGNITIDGTNNRILITD